MKYFYKILSSTFAVTAIIASCILTQSCSGNKSNSNIDSDSISQVMPDTLAAEKPDTTPKLVPESATAQELIDYIKTLPDADKYANGVIYSAIENAPSYAAKLLNSTYSRFIIVDKARMKVILYDKYGHVERCYNMACAKNYGTKHKKADSRTPEGFFSVEGKYDSTDWLFTDDNGVTSQKKGQFGPRFIRLRIPNTTQIGIHGTCSPWSMGHRSSHGCIRILNENILELVELVEVGMPVIVLPGKRDREVNRYEGYDIPYFPTDTEYAMSEEEKVKKPRSAEEVEETRRREEAAQAKADSIKAAREKADSIEANKPQNVAPESIAAPKDSI